ncbi:hypothetical protein Esti_002292 [Eimeria stiedai]
MDQTGKGVSETSGGGSWAGGGAPRKGPREMLAGSRGPPRSLAVERTATLLRASSAETNSELFNYIFSLPPAIPLSLMSGDVGCCCAFRTLSAFDRHVLLRLLPLQQSVSERAMRLWVSPGSVGELRRALQRLTAAHFIVAMVPPAAAPPAASAAAPAGAGEQQQGKSNSSTQQQQQQLATQYALTPSFQKALLQLLLEGPPRTPLPFIGAPPREAFPSRQQLLLHSQRKWEQLLRYVVGASEGDPPGSSSPGGPSADLLKVLRRKSLLCQETFCKGSFLQQQQQLPYGGASALGSSSGGPSSSSSGSMQAGGGPEYTMAREAFSWLLKDLKAQLCSLLLEYFYLVDGGLLSNAAHEASLRGSSNAPKHGRRMQAHSTSSSNSSSSNSSSNNRDASAEAPVGASAALIEQTQRDMQETLLLLTALIESCVGQPFSLAHLTPPQRRLLNFCVDLGIAYISQEGAPQGPNASKGNSAKGATAGKGAPGGGPLYAFAAPYVLLIRRDAYCQKQQQTPQGPLQRRSQLVAAGGPPISAEGTAAEGATGGGGGGPLQSDAASVMEGPFHPWLQADDSCVRVCGREGGASGWASHVSSRASAFGSLGLQPRILVETNFKVYMYTSSPLHTSVLAHLCELTARLPNLVVGLLTRASVLGALKAGITAEQIIGFLEAHAHQVALESKTKHNRPLIPENVAIQLRMWEQERQRLTLCPAVVFKGWDAALLPELFQRSVRWAVAKGCALHHTMWPEDPNSPAFAEWMAREKYLAVHADARADIVARIRDVRDELLAQRAGAPRPSS